MGSSVCTVVQWRGKGSVVERGRAGLGFFVWFLGPPLNSCLMKHQTPFLHLLNSVCSSVSNVSVKSCLDP